MGWQLYRFLSEHAGEWADRPAISAGPASVTYGQLLELADRFRERLSPWAGRAIGLALSAGPDWVAVAAAADRLGCRTFLLAAPAGEGRCGKAEAEELAERHELAAVCCRTGEQDGQIEIIDRPADTGGSPGPAGSSGPGLSGIGQPGPSAVVLFTSGTSGEPKAAVHTWASLTSGVRRSEALAGVRVLLAYDLNRYAGVQVLLTALVNGGRLSIPTSRQIGQIVEVLIRDQVELVSGTPTFWRMLLGQSSPEQRARMAIRQATLGGEPIDRAILDALARAFPRARITQIYASTEMGVCFSVHDGREGFPAELLGNSGRGQPPVELKVEEGQLWIRSRRAMAGYVGGEAVEGRWFNTGDAVKIEGGRVRFLGRLSGRINVGGEKVYPEEIEAVIRQVAGVAAVRVSGVASSIVGQLVEAEVVAEAGAEQGELRRRIVTACRERLASYKQPRVVKFVANLAGSDTMKLTRGNSAKVK